MQREIKEEVKQLNLGKKIRDLRLKRKLTLQNVSDKTGLSKPLLSQIENDMAAPPIATLLKISKALGVSIGYFFQEDLSRDRIVVVRQEERRDVMLRVPEEAEKVGYHYEALAYPRESKHMEPFMVVIEPMEEDELIYYNHRGEEFIFVLEGHLEFRAGEEIISLSPGDSLYFDSDIPHALRGLHGRRARALVVIYQE